MSPPSISRVSLAAVLALVLTAVARQGWPATGDEPLARVEASRLSMGCVYSIVAYGARAGEVREALEAALDEVDRIDRLASNYRRDSALSRLNAAAARGPVRVDPELLGLITEAMAYAVESEGAFDITVGPLLEAWGFFDGEGHVPSTRQLAAARRLVGYRHVWIDAARQSIRFDRPGVEIDLGGIAKGYAVDRIVAMLLARGVAAALVSAGGSTIHALGAPPNANAWEVAVQDPLDRRKVAMTLPLRDRSLSVSGSSERFFEAGGVRYSHIMDPRTGRPVQGVLATVVLAGSGTESDALGTALFVLGVQRARRALEKHPGAQALFFQPVSGRSWSLVRLPGADRD